MIVFLDFEASSLSKKSYPIEVACELFFSKALIRAEFGVGKAAVLGDQAGGCVRSCVG
jgi:hypothetical protein